MKGRDLSAKTLFQDEKKTIYPIVVTRKTNTTPIRFIWKSSIPNAWFKCAGERKFEQITGQDKGKRDTLMFLKETQKYIHNICKPKFPELTEKDREKVLSPSKKSKSARDSSKTKKPKTSTRDLKSPLKLQGSLLTAQFKKPLMRESKSCVDMRKTYQPSSRGITSKPIILNSRVKADMDTSIKRF
mmetsp:Transcript_9648/g.14373  ORF Transcript_9648/g.14373 Transcript_9648/m.14373 type:complete len:186 (+) Transcript_9648:14-571(+)